jgi:hypothetical protein
MIGVKIKSRPFSSFRIFDFLNMAIRTDKSYFLGLLRNVLITDLAEDKS